jgi:hypothetical protein
MRPSDREAAIYGQITCNRIRPVINHIREGRNAAYLSYVISSIVDSCKAMAARHAEGTLSGGA